MAGMAGETRFLGLVDEHRRILFKIARVYGRSPADREDLMQEIVLQLWRSFERYDERLKFSTWMYRIALNVAISCSRRAARGRAVVPAEDSLLAIAAEARSASAERDVATLNELIEGLGPLDKALMVMSLDGQRHEAIAEVLGISVSNVGTRIGRIKERIRRDWPLTGSERSAHHGTR